MTIIGGTNNGPKKDAKPPTEAGTNEGQVKFQGDEGVIAASIVELEVQPSVFD